MIVRLALLMAVLAGGSAMGLLGRWAAQRRDPVGGDHAVDLAPGLWLLTAPYCHRCERLRDRLESIRPVVAYGTVDVCERPDLVRALDIRSAPTLLAIGADGRVQDQIAGDATEDGLERLLDGVTAGGATHRSSGP